MFKKLAILGHETRNEEVIELLTMLGGRETFGLSCIYTDRFYYVSDEFIHWDYDDPIVENKFEVFTLEKFLEKFPFKVGDFVRIPEYESEVRICKMKWTPFSDIEYLVYRNDDEEWYTVNELLEYNDNPNKTRDCKKCGLHFGSVRCFDKDCPHNTPKSYAVGLKDGKVIECGVNKENVMNEIKPLFKDGDVVKLKGCPDKNLFWIVMDVVKDGYIFNDGKKYSFDVQHHYEKTNIKIINMTKETITPTPDITADVTDKNNCGIQCPDGYEFYDENGDLIGTKVMMRPKKPTYPTTYEECYDEGNTELHFIYVDKDERDLYESFIQLIRCRNAYWKIAGEELGLGKPWEPDWNDQNINKYCLATHCNMIVRHTNQVNSRVFSFPTSDMRDAFYENFEDLIEYCKELL